MDRKGGGGEGGGRHMPTYTETATTTSKKINTQNDSFNIDANYRRKK
jgi:hypothetical protein